MAASNAPTQKFVPIRDVKDGVVVLKNGKLVTIMLATSINFALKSTDEQRAILHQFQSFLNTLDFSLQFYVQSRRLNIQPYLNLLQARESEQDNDLMRIQLREYMEFIRTFTNEVDIMTKNFFVVIPYTASVANIAENISNFGKMVGKKAEPLPEDKFQEEKTQLDQRVSVVEQGLNRLGIKTVPLGNEELVELYYHIFNPDEVNSQPPQQQ